MEFSGKKFLLLALPAFLASGPAFAITTLFDMLNGPTKSAKDLNMTCAYSSDYQQSNPQAMPQCKTCAGKVIEWRDKLEDIAKKAVAQDNALNASGATATANPASGLGSTEVGSFKASGSTANAGKSTQTARSTNAADASTQFKKCSKEITDACSGAKKLLTPDLNAAQSMQKACDDAASGAGQVAAEAKKSGDTMGDMGKLMDLASKAMGMASQLAQQQQQGGATSPTPDSGNGGATSPTPNSTNGSETSSMAGKSGTGTVSPTVGFSAIPTPVAASTAGGGGGSSGASSPERKLASNDLGTPSGGGGAATGGVGGGGGGGGTSGASGNATGASRPIDGEAAAAAASNFEVNPGGSRAMVGLKPGKGDLDAVADGATTPPLDAAKLDDLGAAKDPAAENAANDDALSHDGESIFLRVKQKYSLLKGSGRI